MPRKSKDGNKIPPRDKSPEDVSNEKLFPDWLPPSVASWIVESWNHEEHVLGRWGIITLANALPMQKLWAELSRREGVGQNRAYLHKANRDFLLRFFDVSAETRAKKAEALVHLDDSEMCQSVAYVYLFRQFLHFATSPSSFITENEATAKIAEMRQRAVWLRMEAHDTELLAKSNKRADWLSIATGMRAKADVLEECAELLPKYRPTTKNSRRNRRGMAVALDISAVLNAIFSHPFYRLSAELGTYLTGEDTTFEQVRAERSKQNPYVSFRRD